MREIKFRVWNDINDSMYDWEAMLCEDLNRYFELGVNDDNSPVILMQYTGLKDKNGVEIYEGDIVKQTMKATSVDDHIWIYLVRQDERPNSQFGNTLFSWTIKDNFAEPNENEDPDKYTFRERVLEYPVRNYIRSGKDCEVIGNIYENPELLK